MTVARIAPADVYLLGPSNTGLIDGASFVLSVRHNEVRFFRAMSRHPVPPASATKYPLYRRCTGRAAVRRSVGPVPSGVETGGHVPNRGGSVFVDPGVPLCVCF